jgi:flavin-dependent dehydrogenase
VEVHWSAKAQLYITPVSSNEIGVVVLSRDPKLRLQEALAFFPIVRERLKNCEATTAERGAATGNLSLPAVCSGNIALIGDASGTVDAITGEGMSLAFQQAEALAEAIARRDLFLYAAAHARLQLRPIWMARLLLMLQGQPKLQERVLRIFAAEPELFQKMLTAHLGYESTFSLAATGARLGLLLLASNFS